MTDQPNLTGPDLIRATLDYLREDVEATTDPNARLALLNDIAHAWHEGRGTIATWRREHYRAATAAGTTRKQLAAMSGLSIERVRQIEDPLVSRPRRKTRKAVKR